MRLMKTQGGDFDAGLRIGRDGVTFCFADLERGPDYHGGAGQAVPEGVRLEADNDVHDAETTLPEKYFSDGKRTCDGADYRGRVSGEAE